MPLGRNCPRTANAQQIPQCAWVPGPTQIRAPQSAKVARPSKQPQTRREFQPPGQFPDLIFCSCRAIAAPCFFTSEARTSPVRVQEIGTGISSKLRQSLARRINKRPAVVLAQLGAGGRTIREGVGFEGMVSESENQDQDAAFGSDARGDFIEPGQPSAPKLAVPQG